MRIFGAGISTETNTFAPVPTVYDDFAIQRGSAAEIAHPGLDLDASWGAQARAAGHEFVFGLMALAPPHGLTMRAAYERLRDELLATLAAAMPVDIVLLNLHGAMVAQDYAHCEIDLVERVRAIVGSTVPIAVELDLHCHLHPSLIDACDLIITYKEYPHDDVLLRGAELLDLAVRIKSGQIHPTMAMFDCRMVGFYPTSRAPLRAFVDSMTAAEARPGVLSVSLAHGFPFADLPDVGAKMLVVTDNDPALAAGIAEEFGTAVHALRHRIGFESISLPIDAAFATALASHRTPVTVADQADNVGGGAPGDATFALRWLIENRVENAAVAIIFDPEVVRMARAMAPGDRLPIRLGGKTGPMSGPPVDLDVTILAHADDYQHAFPQASGEDWLFPAGHVVAVTTGAIDIVISSVRCQCFSPAIFSDLGIDPRTKRLLVPKSYQHFQGAFAALGGEIIYMAAQGAVTPDPRNIPYRSLDTSNLYPWVAAPSLSPPPKAAS